MFWQRKKKEIAPLPDITEVSTVINGIDYGIVDPSRKWQMLKTQKRFAAWGRPSSDIDPL